MGVIRRALSCVLAALALAAGANGIARAENPNGIALIIGNENYRAGVPKVDYAINDAELMRRYAIDILGYREGNVFVLWDATLGDFNSWFGTQRNPRGRLAGMVRPGLTELHVIFSGHGAPGEPAPGVREGYLLPVDANPVSPEDTGYSIELLKANLAAAGAASVTVYLDACFTGTARNGTALDSVRGLGVVPLTASPQLTIVAAARANQVARADPQAQQGLFTEYLWRALKGAADAQGFGNGDGKVTLGEAAKYLDQEMTYRARALFNRDQNAEPLGRPEVVLATLPALRTVAAAAAVRLDGANEAGRVADEGPQHAVTIARPFAAGKFEVTKAEFGMFVRATNRAMTGGCFVLNAERSAFAMDATRSWADPGFTQTDRDPAVCVSWDDAKGYVAWLSQRTGQTYRLLTESEWEYAARAGTATARFWGDAADAACGYANVADQTATQAFGWTGIHNCADGHVYTAPAGSYRANVFGLHEVLGNVWEWVEDCWHNDYTGAPVDGTAWVLNCAIASRVLRGGSWDFNPDGVRSADRNRGTTGIWNNNVGFRVARTL